MAFFSDRIKPEQLNELVRIIENITNGNIDSRISISGASESLAPVLHALQELQTKEKKLKASETLFRSKMNAVLTSTVNGKLDARISFDSLPEGGLRTTSEDVNAILDAVVTPLKVASNYVERISKGDIPPAITDSYNGDFNIIKNNLNTCISAISSMVAEAANLERAAIEGRLATRADANRYQGDYRKVVEGVNNCLDAVINPLNVAANYVDRIAKGDIPPAITDTYNGDFNTIKNNLNTCISAISSMVAEAANLERAAIEGRLVTRADANKYQGDYRKVVEGVNNCLDAVIGPLNVAANYVDHIAKGNIPSMITDTYNGDFNTIKNNLNTCIEAINSMVAEAANLEKAAIDGRLATRADATKYQGDYRKVVEGVNNCLDAVIGPLNVAANYVERIAKGDIPPAITDTYNGDFNTIKNNLNLAIDAINEQAATAQAIAHGDLTIKVNVRSKNDEVGKSLLQIVDVLQGLLKELQMLTVASTEGQLSTRGKPEQFSGAYADVVKGINEMLNAVATPMKVTSDYIDQIAKGIIPATITTDYKGEYLVIRNNLNGLIQVMSDLLKQTDIIIHAAANGELDKRANADLFQGGWKQLIVGVNDTVSNIVNPLNVTADYVEQIANGVIPPVITIEYKGQYNVIKKNLNNAVKMMSDLLAQTDILIQGAAVGELDKRANADLFQGGWKQLIIGVNDTVKNIAEPMKVTSDYINQIANGVIPAHITTDYQGEYRVIRDNLNTLVKMMGDLLKETDILIQGAAVGELEKRANADMFQGGWKQLVIGVNDTVKNIAEPMKVTSDYINQIANGVIPAHITTDYQGEYRVIRDNLNTLVKMMGDLLRETGALIQGAAAGELNKRANASQFQGGWNELVVGVNQILDGIVLPVNEAVAVLKEMEKGDLTRSVNGDYKGQLKDFKDTVNNTIGKLSQVISEVNGAAANIASASEEVSATAQNMSQAASEQAASVEETSASIEQMSASISQNTENAKVTDGMATQASTEAVQGGEAVKETVHAMKSIAGKIGIIDDIAYQTNLLALNAAIEAARAGEHGKGFAVVAAEVRKLAERSQVAAQEIGELAESSVDRAESAGKLLDTIVPSIKKTSDLVQEIAAASEEQSAGVSQINVAVNQLNQVTQQNAASSEELAATSEEMSGQAAQLQELMSFFTVEGSSNVKRKPAIKKPTVPSTKPIHDEDEFVQF